MRLQVPVDLCILCRLYIVQVYRIVASPLFQKYQCDEYIVNKLITFGYTVTQAKILYGR